MINIRNSSNKFGIVYKKTQSARNIMNYNKKDDELNLPIEELPQKNTVKDMVLKIEKKKSLPIVIVNDTIVDEKPIINDLDLPTDIINPVVIKQTTPLYNSRYKDN